MNMTVEDRLSRTRSDVDSDIEATYERVFPLKLQPELFNQLKRFFVLRRAQVEETRDMSFRNHQSVPFSHWIAISGGHKVIGARDDSFGW